MKKLIPTFVIALMAIFTPACNTSSPEERAKCKAQAEKDREAAIFGSDEWYRRHINYDSLATVMNQQRAVLENSGRIMTAGDVAKAKKGFGPQKP